MSGKGDNRIRESVRGAYVGNYDNIFRPPYPVECPGCGEIELRPTTQVTMWACGNCGLMENRTC